MSKSHTVYAFMVIIMFLNMIAEYLLDGGNKVRFQYNYEMWGERVDSWMKDVGAKNLWDEDDE